MKRAVILHGTDGTPGSNWFPWLKAKLEARGYEVWVPKLPNAHLPAARRYTDFLLGAGWDYQDNLVIGHSSGAVEILHLLQNLPAQSKLQTAVLVGAFTWEQVDDPAWAAEKEFFESQLRDIFEEPFDFDKIKSKAKHFLCVHSDNDPYCDPKRAEKLAKKLGGEYIEIAGGQHFSTGIDPTYKEFPRLVALLDQRHLL